MQSMSITKDTKRFYIKSFLFLSPRQRFRVAIFNFLIIIVFFVWFFSLLELFQSVLDHLSSLSSALLHFLECWSRHLKEQLRFVHSLIPHLSLLGFFPKFAIKVTLNFGVQFYEIGNVFMPGRWFIVTSSLVCANGRLKNRFSFTQDSYKDFLLRHGSFSYVVKWKKRWGRRNGDF